LLRSGAQAGDRLVVTGTLGDAGAGLQFATRPLQKPPRRADSHGDKVLELIHRFEYPAPRVQFGIAARGIASAAMDVSDGLVGDLPKLAEASGLAAQIAVERLPLSDALRAAATSSEARDWALAAGDDYELLLAVPPARMIDLHAAAARLNLRLTDIGRMDAGSGVTWSLNGEEFLPAVAGYEHFGRASTQITV
jgi:thiamine-monophosphate kinase